MSEVHEWGYSPPPTCKLFLPSNALTASSFIHSAGVHFTCHSSKLPLGIRLSVNSPKSCEVDVFRVLSYLTADQVLSPPLVVETVDFRILDVELGALRKGKFASIDIILALDHLHAGGA